MRRARRQFENDPAQRRLPLWHNQRWDLLRSADFTRVELPDQDGKPARLKKRRANRLKRTIEGIARCSGRKEGSDACVEVLASHSYMEERTFQRGRADAVAANLVQVNDRQAPRGGQISNHYDIDWYVIYDLVPEEIRCQIDQKAAADAADETVTGGRQTVTPPCQTVTPPCQTVTPFNKEISPPIPSPSWREIQERLMREGVGKNCRTDTAAVATETTRRRGYSSEKVAAIIDHYRDVGRWGPGALFLRLTKVAPHVPVADGWCRKDRQTRQPHEAEGDSITSLVEQFAALQKQQLGRRK